MPAAAEMLSATPRLNLRVNRSSRRGGCSVTPPRPFYTHLSANMWWPSLSHDLAAERRPPPNTRVFGDGDTLRFKNSGRNVESTPLIYAPEFELELTTVRWSQLTG